MKPGLQHMELLCAELGHPERYFRSIHIVGTNGKGETAFLLAEILRAHEKRVGLFTSPHLVSVRDRIRVDGQMVRDNLFDLALDAVRQAAERKGILPSFFETLTLAAFLVFMQERVEIACLEAGLGGRLDCTRVARGSLTLLTSIGLDHTAILGETKEKILLEKMLIAEPGSLLLVGDLEHPLKGMAKELSRNAAKILLTNQYNKTLTNSVIKKSIWHGRLERLGSEWILDGAHNPAAAQYLAGRLQSLHPRQKFPVLFASLADNDTEGVVAALAPIASEWRACATSHTRMRSPQETAEICARVTGIQTKVVDLDTELAQAPPAPTLVAGSLYLVGHAIAKLAGRYEQLAEFRGLEEFSNEQRI
jgi:dihydrofolate synthase/folylpolyglutamate synthase